MNARLLYRLMLLAILASVFCITALGQQTASVTWNLVAPDSARPSTIVGQLDADTISGSNFVIANYGGTPVGPMGVNYMRWYPGNGVSWGSETAEVTNRYIQLSVSPKPGNSFTTDSITFWSAGGGTGNMKANFYASSDPTFTTKTMLNTGGDVALPQNTVGPARYAYGVQTTVNSGQTFYFRIYPWYTGSASTSKYVYTQLAVIKGTTTSSTSVDDHAGAIVPSAFSLEQNYPNPFNPSTEIRYQVPVAANVSLKVYNLLGLEVATIAKGVQQAGIHVARWDATGMPSGVYFYKIEAGSYARTLKMVLQK
jgi:hypothetical protein